MLAGNGCIASTLIYTEQIINNGIADTITANDVYPNFNDFSETFSIKPSKWMWCDCLNDSAIWIITVYDPNNIADSSSTRVIWKCVLPTSIEDYSNDQRLDIFPNPTNSKVNFNSKLTGRLNNILGDEVLLFNEVFEIDISDMRKGIYFLKTKESTIKIIKQ